MTQTAFGTWEYEGDTDWFSVELTAGVTYQLSIAGPNGFVYRVANPGMSGPVEAGFNYISRAPGLGDLSLQGFAYAEADADYDGGEPGHFTPLESGTYWFSATGLGVGNYSVELVEVVDDIADNIASTSVVAINGGVGGRAEAASDADFHRVTLAANQAIYYDVSGDDDQIEVLVTDAAGTIVSYDSDDDGGSGFFVADTAGDYFIVTVASSNPRLFTPTDYTLSVTATELDDYGPTQGTAGTLVLTEAASGMLRGSLVGNLDYEEGDRDVIKVDLVAGQTYQFRLSGNIFASGDAYAFMYVYEQMVDAVTPYRQSFTAYGSNGATGITTFYAEYSGTHYIEVDGDYGLGAYNLDVTQIADDFSAGSDRTGTLTVGVAGSGTFESNRDSDWFAVELTAGTSYNLTASAAGTSFRTTNLTFYNADEVAVGSIFTAETSGTYYARVLGSTSTFPINPANYSVTVNSYVDDYANNISTTGRLHVGGSVQGRTEVAADTDWFAINLVAGQTYRFVHDNGFGGQDLEIHSSTGELLAFNLYDEYAARYLDATIFTAATTGTYYVSTVPAGQTYTLSATLVSDDFVDFASAAGSFLDAPFYDGRGKTAMGDAGDDRFLGKLRDDLLRGLGGSDTLIGGGGDDVIDGGAGIDRMAGNDGNDTYVVDNAGDRVSEDAANGIDTVYASVNYRLGVNVENLVLTGTALTARGSDGDNAITGSDGDNAISGLVGADVLRGLGGDDRLDGGAGDDILWGGAGRDVLTGGTGKDHFAFAVGDGSAAGSDTIADFSKADGDLIDLAAIDAPLTFVGTAGFSGEAGEVWTQVKGGVTFVRIDLNGDRADDLTIRVNGVTDLTAADFVF